ncbi:hypothetical protein O0L34_g17639 [Tuta absoluta]|nr:hypothetical protein O0L34_g17639 [Tuta absoluta]
MVFICCTACKKCYHDSCIARSQKLFDLIKRKTDWKCKACRDNREPYKPSPSNTINGKRNTPTIHAGCKPCLPLQDVPAKPGLLKNPVHVSSEQVSTVDLGLSAGGEKLTCATPSPSDPILEGILETDQNVQDQHENKSLSSLCKTVINNQTSNSFELLQEVELESSTTTLPLFMQSADHLLPVCKSSEKSQVKAELTQHTIQVLHPNSPTGRVTFRRKRAISNCSVLDSDETQKHAVMNLSLPTTLYDTTEINDLKEQIALLTSNLKSAEAEIENMGLENLALSFVHSLENIIKRYKSVGVDISTSGSTPKKIFFSPKYRNINQSQNTSKLTSVDMSFQINHAITSSPKHSAVINNVKPLQERSTENKKIPEHSKPLPRKKVSTEDILHDVIILSDEKGRNLRQYLQNFLGKSFSVKSVIKPYATVGDILDSCHNWCNDFTNLDFIIILAGTNDQDALKFDNSLQQHLKSFDHTNVLIGDISYNKYGLTQDLNNIVNNISSTSNRNNLGYFEVFKSQKNTCRSMWRAIMHHKYGNGLIPKSPTSKPEFFQTETKEIATKVP